MSNGQEKKKIMKPENVIHVPLVKVREGFMRKEDSVVLEREKKHLQRNTKEVFLKKTTKNKTWFKPELCNRIRTRIFNPNYALETGHGFQLISYR